MHVFICFSVVQFLTLIFSLSLKSIYSVTLVPGCKSCENNDNMSHDMTKTPSDAQADLSLRWTHTHFVGFVMSRLNYNETIK